MSSGSLDTESNKIKKTILLRYPFNIFEQASRLLVIYSTFRGNNKRFKALMIMDELIDYCTFDVETNARVHEISDQNKDRVIAIPKNLVDAFKQIFHGDADGWMRKNAYESIPAMIYLSPSTTGMNPKEDLVIIRKAVPFRQVWRDRPTQYTALIAGFSYKIQEQGPNGFPVTETIPMFDWNDPDIETYFTNSIPYNVFTEWFDQGWREIAPICTMIEKVIAKRLEDKGFKPAEAAGIEASGDGGLDDTSDGEFEL